MSSNIVSRSVRAVPSLETCLRCKIRQFFPAVRPYATKSSLSRAPALGTGIQTRHYAMKMKLDAPRLRADIDARSRLGFYTLNKQQAILAMEPHTAQSIYADFAAHKNNTDYGSQVQRIVQKYNVQLDDVTSLAILTFKIPDLSDPAKRALLPSSSHKKIAGLLLQGCAQAEDPLAIVHVLTAVYLANSGNAAAYEIMTLFPRQEIARYRETLKTLRPDPKKTALGPEVLTLRGLFFEQEGQKDKAKEMYLEAINTAPLKYEGGSRHPMQLPLMAPWNLLGYMLKNDKDPKLQAEAKTYFEKGALEGDDPLSYYELAAFEPRTSEKWLKYTSKAAGSNHRQAIVDLAAFYQEVAKPDSIVLKDGSIRKALKWLLEWRHGSAAKLAREWLQAASNIGHKPSMLQLADYHASIHDHERAMEYLRRMLDPPSTANRQEEWPQLVQLAKRRLAGIR
ncbi:hypothetical protein HRS9139_07623 [Pyrenophora teres f. teres]|nr:hypothetical protein HRS9139_07623 [Pyrenophora teres f. teres]KAE8856995.1 hypothetical protein PTNB29_08062 [Pyrenophora teres f. teres]CAE7188391.1 hypothetical protein PTTW11_07315 [Pyrenophora teres f. teres]